MIRWAAVYLSVCCAAVAQNQSPAVIHVDVNLGQVDAVVIDAKNYHVSNLKAEDFEVQIVVSDKLAKTNYQTASQWMDFEVRQ